MKKKYKAKKTTVSANTVAGIQLGSSWLNKLADDLSKLFSAANS